MLSDAGLVAPVLLASVLVLSAIAKWRDPLSTRSAIAELRMPRAVRAPWVARALPIGELVVALVLLSPWQVLARPAAVAALILFTLYFVVIARAMTFDPRPSCGCFGRIGDHRVRPRTLVRNAVFVGLAVVGVAFAADHTVPHAVSRLEADGWAWLAACLVAVTVTGLVTAGPSADPAGATAGSAPLRPRAAEPATDEDALEDYVRVPIPAAILLDPEGQPHTLRDLVVERARVLVFANCYCGPTHAALVTAPSWQASIPQLDLSVVLSGLPAGATVEGLDTSSTWRDHGSTAWETLGLTRSPSAVLLGADGELAGGPVGGIDEVDQFIADIAEALQGVPADPH